MRKNTTPEAIIAIEAIIITHRAPVLCLDSRWQTKAKWLWDAWAAANEGYTGYVDIWDTIPWQQVVLEDGMPHDFNYAAMAQYLPSYGGSGDYYHIFDPCVASGLNEAYCHNCLGLVGDIIALLEADGIADEIIKATYNIMDAGAMKAVPLRDLFFRNFDPANICCPIVFSRPMTYNKGGAGHIGDNNQQVFFVRAVDSCDGTEGLRVTLAPETYRNEFRADSMHFLRTVPVNEMLELLHLPFAEANGNEGAQVSLPSALADGIPATARLVVYAIACGSVPRIQINGIWHVVSPTYFPPYGDPYGYCFRGHKHLVGAIHELPLHLGAGESNDFVVEHIAPLSDEIGAQVIFAIEWDETIIDDNERRVHMARSVADDIEQGGLIKNEDNAAVAAGAPEALSAALRAEHDTALADLQLKHNQAHDADDVLHSKVVISKNCRDACENARRKIQLYVKSTYNKQKAAEMLGLLNLDKPLPHQNNDAVQSLKETREQFAHFDGTPEQIPDEYKIPFKTALAAFDAALLDSDNAKGVANNAYEERDIVHHAYAEILARIRAWLLNKLPQGIRDEKLIEYGFDPLDERAYPIPAPAEGLTAQWVAENHYVELHWLAAQNANDYEIFLALKPADPNAHPKFKRLAKTDNLFYYYSDAKPGKTYVFKVRGVTHFRQGEFSEMVEVSV